MSALKEPFYGVKSRIYDTGKGETKTSVMAFLGFHITFSFILASIALLGGLDPGCGMESKGFDDAKGDFPFYIWKLVR